MKQRPFLLIMAFALNCGIAQAANISATVYSTDSKPTELGRVVFTETAYGILITPSLKGLQSGLHGFHLHQHPDCGDAGNHAGSHYDPANTNSHQGPYGNGHLGDLPVLYVSPEGVAEIPVLAPRLKIDQLANLTVMIHANGDNYSDNPPLGGGGARIACGVIK